MTLVKHILAFGATRDNRNPTIPTSQLGIHAAKRPILIGLELDLVSNM